MILRPKNNVVTIPGVGSVHIFAVLGALALFGLLFVNYIISSSSLTDNSGGDGLQSSSKDSSNVNKKVTAPVVVRVHELNAFVPASAYSGSLKKPLEVINKDTVSCPERGGKNTQCGKVSSEYRFKAPSAGDYYVYVQVIAPGLNDNSLWIGLAEDSGVDTATYYDDDSACATPSEVGKLIPHKHLTSSSKKFLCCPAYLAKNKKKGLTGFYSDCCYPSLGKESNEKGCVLDLEVDSGQRWNEMPRVIRTSKDNQVVSVKIYAREDGTSWTGIVMSDQPALDDEGLSEIKRSKA